MVSESCSEKLKIPYYQPFILLVHAFLNEIFKLFKNAVIEKSSYDSVGNINIILSYFFRE